jgi:hypothetical protein
VNQLAGHGLIGAASCIPYSHPPILEECNRAAVIVLKRLFGGIAYEIAFNDGLIHFVETPGRVRSGRSVCMHQTQRKQQKNDA